MSTGDTARTSYELASNQAVERIRLRDNALLAFLGATGVIFGVATSASDRAALLLMIPYLALAAVFIVTQHDRTIGALSAFITETLSPYLRTIGEEAPLWERSVSLQRFASSAMVLRSSSHAILILLPVAFSLAWTRQYMQLRTLLAVCWWVGLVVGSISAYLLITTYVERIAYYMSANWEADGVDGPPVVAQQAEGREGSIWPNTISGLRIALAITLLPLFQSSVQRHYTATLCVFLLAAATDLLDGYVARRLRAVSSLGDVLDLVADRVLIIVSVVLLAVARVASLYLCVLVILREAVADSVRAFGVRGASGRLPHNALGRAKFCAIVVATSVGLLGLSGVLSGSVAVVSANASLAAALLLGISSVVIMLRQMRARQYSRASHDKQSEGGAVGEPAP
jgi:CDP-diacylglycerol--glycerol-3-phosphate 3-phosphatidyltransferase